jgi:VWFA-related protein
MGKRPGALAAVLTSCAAMVFAPLLEASPLDKSEPAKATPVFASEVSLVSIPVFVSNREGSALAGLHVEDFQLFEDGKQVPIVAFQYVDTTAPEDQEQIRQSPAARRRFLYLFDLSFTDPGGLHRAQVAARDFVRTRLAESDLAAVATFDTNRGIRLVANFTEDRNLLLHAIETLGVPTLARINDPLSLSFQSSDVASTASRGFGNAESNTQQTDSVLAFLTRRLRQADQNIYRNQVQGLIGSMEELGKSLRNVEGRKQVLYFSAGFDAQALTGMSGSAMREASEALAEGRFWEVDSNDRYGDNRLRDSFGVMTKVLSAADCVVHAVDVTGLGTDASLTQVAATKDAVRNTAGRDSLHFISAETGGRLFKDTNDLAVVLNEVRDMTSRFYVLGYQPENARGPSKFHKLKVKVARKNVNLSHRAGFFERVPVAQQTALQRKFEAAQLVMTGAGPNSLKFSSMCLPFPEKGERQSLGVVLQVPREQLNWQSGQPVALEVYGYAVAQDGTVVDHMAQLARLDPAQADPDQLTRGLSFYGTFHVPPGQYTIKLMVEETQSGVAGAQFLDVMVPPHDPRVGFLLPPVVMDDAGKWLGLDMNAQREGKADYPFQVNGKPFLPRATFQVQAGEPEKLVLIAYEPGQIQDPTSAIEIQSSLTDAKGSPVPAGFLRIEKVNREPGGRRTYVLGYTPEKIAAGDYTLRIGVGESGSPRLESYALLRVRGATP